jgi:hypothetical protein
MESAIRTFLQEQELRGNIALATLLDDLYLNGQEDLAASVEEAMETHGLSSSTRVDTLLRRVSEEETGEPTEAETEDANEGEGDEEESGDDEDDE